MVIAGLGITLLGFVISVASLGMSAVEGRLAVVILGMIVSLVGIIGLINRAYLAQAIWRR